MVKNKLKKKINAKISKELNQKQIPKPYTKFIQSFRDIALLPFAIIKAGVIRLITK